MNLSKTGVLLVLAVILSGAGQGMADLTIGGVDYYESGPSETVTAVFTTPDGGVTVGTYSGLVKLTVSGTGQSLASYFNDAFYVLRASGPTHYGHYYQLAFDTQPLVPFNPARDVKHFIFYDLDADVEVTPTYVPTYAPAHVYSFVVDTGAVVPTDLHFGVSNGMFGDNSGAFAVEVTQLQEVPVPGAVFLGMIGLATVGLIKRKYA